MIVYFFYKSCCFTYYDICCDGNDDHDIMLVILVVSSLLFHSLVFCISQGAFWGLMVAMVAGVIRMILGYVYPDPGCGEPDDRPYFIAHVHYMYFALFLFLLTAVIMVTVSLLTKPPTDEQVSGSWLNILRSLAFVLLCKYIYKCFIFLIM